MIANLKCTKSIPAEREFGEWFRLTGAISFAQTRKPLTHCEDLPEGGGYKKRVPMSSPMLDLKQSLKVPLDLIKKILTLAENSKIDPEIMVESLLSYAVKDFEAGLFEIKETVAEVIDGKEAA